MSLGSFILIKNESQWIAPHILRVLPFIDQMVFFDGNSTDGTLEYLKGRKIQDYASKVNMGVSKAWNYGLGYFFQTGYDHVLVVNNDVVLRPESYSEFLNDGGEFVTGVGVNEKNQFEANYVKSIRMHPDFSCFMIRKSVWDKIGFFDESMVLYASDADYHVRMHSAGIQAYTIGMPFLHIASGTIKKNPSESQAICRQADADRESFTRKWGNSMGEWIKTDTLIMLIAVFQVVAIFKLLRLKREATKKRLAEIAQSVRKEAIEQLFDKVSALVVGKEMEIFHSTRANRIAKYLQEQKVDIDQEKVHSLTRDIVDKTLVEWEAHIRQEVFTFTTSAETIQRITAEINKNQLKK